VVTKKSSIVFLHGLGGSRADWAPVVALLPKSRKALAVDLPGAGAAEKPPKGYDPASLARWLASFLEKEKLDGVVLVGHSLGARVAGELAASEPSRLSGLVLVSPLGAVSYKLTDKLKWKAMSRRSILSAVPESSMRNASGYGFAVDGPGKKGFVERALASRTGKEGDAIARAVEGSVDGILEARPLAERLKGTTVPLLLVSGALDPLAPPEETKAILRARPDAKFELLTGLGHYPMLEDPPRIAKLIEEFVTRAK
jgi:pimeloyl-ACP methyl ester carboxylesterase